MGLNGKLLHVTVPGVIIFAMVAAAQARPHCSSKCGDVEIPFPFGLTEGCYLDTRFNISCDSQLKARTGDVTVTNISIEAHELRVLHFVARDCYDRSGASTYNNDPTLTTGMFTISQPKNKFTALGCDTYAYLRATQNGERYWTGCMSLCDSRSNMVNGSCTGVGCCEVEIPDGLKDIRIEVGSYDNHTRIWDFNSCGYGFVVEQGQFNFSIDYLLDLPNKTLPLVLDWAVSNETCEEAQKKSDFACQRNSECLNRRPTTPGYHCKCKQGYQGNPYLPDGCKDIDECQDPTLNKCTIAKKCANTEGNYTCSCPKWHQGDGRKDGTGCVAELALIIKIPIVIGISLIAVLVGSSWVYLVLRKRKLIKLKEKFFRQNGGSILLRKQAGATKTLKIFTGEELKKATKNYHESRIIGRGGFGTVYKGISPDNSIVAIKKAKTVDENQIEQFINEVVVLSQVDHPNVVKLLGCCLETQVPLLVHEFVPKGTLFKYIHQKGNASTISWETGLRIAAETANALSYLHSEASTPIIHRDVKSTNILLDDNFTAKVSDFGTSRLVPRDQKEVATVVQGTLGYLDPEYLQTNQLTEKSDVYSFGVVLVELLTGEHVLSFNRSEETRSLAIYFLSSLKEDDRLFEVLEKGLVEEGNKEQIREVVELTKRCLRLRGEDRPTMKEVATELEGIRKTGGHPWVNETSNLEEVEHLLGETSNADKYGGSSSRTAGYDSINNHVTLALGNGR